MFDQLTSPSPFDDEEDDFVPVITVDEEDESTMREEYPEFLPVLALKNMVLFPGIVTPITVGRDRSIAAIHEAYESDRLIAVLAQRDQEIEHPHEEDLYTVGTVARIIKLIRMPDGTITAILQGRRRFVLNDIIQTDPYLECTLTTITYTANYDAETLEQEAMTSSLLDRAERIIDLSPNIPTEATTMLRNITSYSFLLNFLASNLGGTKVEAKQGILEESDLMDKAQLVMEHMNNELKLLELKDKIESKVRGDIEKQQRDYFLNQQLKTIQDELGSNPQAEEVHKLIARGEKKQWNPSVAEQFAREIEKLRRMNPQVAEYSIQLNYLEMLLDLPWNEYSDDNFDLKKVRKQLDADHYGLEKIKERILEHLAVLKLKDDMKAPILCLVGPPGVGKTSLGRSIANAINRKFIRMSLGGVHDESEIRGHRRTYIGSMPGRVLQSLKKAGTSNPVFILDEIDKIGRSQRGDPSSALLEVLDPEQNSTFHDNYLDLDYDLSRVMFIATANSLNTIQPALRDRMEIIRVSGYSLEEKVEIAKRHLVPKQRKEHGLRSSQVRLGKRTLEALVDQYTRESGVRSLDRQIAGVMRSVAKRVAMEEEYEPSIKPADLPAILGPAAFTRDLAREKPVPGVAMGLAWTRFGGDVLHVEASLSKGKGSLSLTGNLGNVMKESARTALSYIKAHSKNLGIDYKAFAEHDLHIHVPEGAIPKDGPSAGITMLTAMTSAYQRKPVRRNLAMSGEITLRGRVLPVGGIKEKVLAAKRVGVKDIILCQDNEKHVDEIDQQYIKGLTFHYVRRMQEVVDFAIA